MYYVISYDISDDKKRTKILKLLKNHGAHVQFSVFECDISIERLTKLVNTMKKTMNPLTDSIRIYSLCDRCKKEIKYAGNAESFLVDSVIII